MTFRFIDWLAVLEQMLFGLVLKQIAFLPYLDIFSQGASNFPTFYLMNTGLSKRTKIPPTLDKFSKTRPVGYFARMQVTLLWFFFRFWYLSSCFRHNLDLGIEIFDTTTMMSISCRVTIDIVSRLEYLFPYVVQFPWDPSRQNCNKLELGYYCRGKEGVLAFMSEWHG